MTPEQAFDEAFSRLLEKKRGGKRSPVERDERNVPPARTGQTFRSLPAPQDTHPVLDRPHPAHQGSNYSFVTRVGRPPIFRLTGHQSTGATAPSKGAQ